MGSDGFLPLSFEVGAYSYDYEQGVARNQWEGARVESARGDATRSMSGVYDGPGPTMERQTPLPPCSWYPKATVACARTPPAMAPDIEQVTLPLSMLTTRAPPH